MNTISRSRLARDYFFFLKNLQRAFVSASLNASVRVWDFVAPPPTLRLLQSGKEQVALREQEGVKGDVYDVGQMSSIILQ